MSGKIVVNTLPGRDIVIEPAPVARDWMDATPDRFAYRCLPLNIANAHGWIVRNETTFNVRWNGGPGLDDMAFAYHAPEDPPAISHFGCGILTFHIPAVITTPPGVAIFATGPLNAQKPGADPLSGIVETDWLPFTFTMNWRLNRRDEWVRFEKGEPVCMFFPVRLAEIESYDLSVRPMEADPDLTARHEAYAASRAEFLARQKADRTGAMRKEWQKSYFRGRDGADVSPGHKTSLRLARPKREG